jgi:hypothetical protein
MGNEDKDKVRGKKRSKKRREGNIIGKKKRKIEKNEGRVLWVFHPLIHVTRLGEVVLANVFLKRLQLSPQNPLNQHNHSRSCHKPTATTLSNTR